MYKYANSLFVASVPRSFPRECCYKGSKQFKTIVLVARRPEAKVREVV